MILILERRWLPLLRHAWLVLAVSGFLGLHAIPTAATTFVSEIVDPPEDVGVRPSLALDSQGNPRISYYNNFPSDNSRRVLKYAERLGTAWSVETADASVFAGNEGSSLALDLQGNPRIAYYLYLSDGMNVYRRLRFAAKQLGGWQFEDFDTSRAASIGDGRVSMRLDGLGYPHVAYYGGSNFYDGDLMYASMATDSTWTVETVVSSGYVGLHASLALDTQGRPCVAYYNGSYRQLEYASKQSGNWVTEVVDGGYVGVAASLAMTPQDEPSICYYDEINHDLKYASKSVGVWTIQVVDTTGDVGSSISLALDAQGQPHVAYSEATNGDLKYAVRSGGVWTIETAALQGNVGASPSLALFAAGSPRVAYEDNSTGNLLYASGDRAPTVAAPTSMTRAEGSLVTASVTATDPDGDAITSLTAGPLPPRASFIQNSENTGGTLTWRPKLGEAGAYAVIFTASNALATSATTMITITEAVCAPFQGLATHVDYATGSYPLSVAIADVNGDGDRDLAVTGYFATVSIFLGNGDGTFAPRTDFIAGEGSYALAMGDWDADGKPDLAVANRDDSTISVLLGNGDGTFEAKADYATGAGPVSIASGDFNADGRLDLVTANIYASTASALLGNGDGTFGSKTDCGTGSQPFSVDVGDLTGDGRLDLAVAPNNGIHANVLPGNGDGTFGSAIGLLTGAYPQAVVIGDWNGDGKQDLAVGKDGSNLVSVLLGTGGGSFGPVTDYGTAGNAYALATGDLDGNGHLDLIASNSNAGSISVFFGVGDGTFASKADFAAVGGAARAAVGDLNGDGRPDIAVGSSSGSSVSVLLNLCSDITEVADQGSPRPTFALSQNKPNPFNPSTAISFEVRGADPVRLYVFSPGGRLVTKLVDGTLSPGPHEVLWSGQDGRGGRLPSGVYYYRLEAAGQRSTKRMVLLR